MKKKQWSTEKIAAILQDAEGAVPLSELSCNYGMSAATFYNWRKNSVV